MKLAAVLEIDIAVNFMIDRATALAAGVGLATWGVVSPLVTGE
ncbi:hypothetical protein AB0F68_18475 [Micromonospora sp. NPDC023966]